MSATTNPFFVTCGRGMEHFVHRELNLIDKTMNVDTSIEGKVFFNYVSECPDDDSITESGKIVLLQLKSVERLFLTVLRQNKKSFKAFETIDVAAILSKNLFTWKDKYDTWKILVNRSSSVVSSSDAVLEQTDAHDLPPSKKQKIEDDRGVVSEGPSYRLSCKSAGSICKRYPAEKLSRLLCPQIKKRLNWSTDLKNPTLEVFVHLNDSSLVVGFPLSNQPLSKRHYMKTISLRSTICWSMAYSGDINKGDTILDPMCGKGTILVEAVKSFQAAGVLGIDNCVSQLKEASANLSFADIEANVDLIEGSATEMPLRSKCVDVILCDFPFGIQHGTVQDAKNMLPKVLQEMNRVCKMEGRVVILISNELSLYLLDCVKSAFPRPTLENKLWPTKCTKSEPMSRNPLHKPVLEHSGSWWKYVMCRFIKLGEQDAHIYKFVKKS